MPELDAAKEKNRRFCHKAAPGKIAFEMCKGHKFMCEFITKCHGMGLEGRGVTTKVQHKAERGPNVDGWDLTLVIDCTKEQHERLQKLIGHQLAEDRLPNRPDLGKDVDSGARWDLGVYMSELANTLVGDGTGSGTTVRSCVKGGKKAANKQVDDGTGKGTTVRSCVKGGKEAANKQVDDGTGKGTTARACVKGGNTPREGPRHHVALANCITCNMVPRKQGSDKCNPCQLAVFFST
jgi:hypothetical protein